MLQYFFTGTLPRYLIEKQLIEKHAVTQWKQVSLARVASRVSSLASRPTTCRKSKEGFKGGGYTASWVLYDRSSLIRTPYQRTQKLPTSASNEQMAYLSSIHPFSAS